MEVTSVEAIPVRMPLVSLDEGGIAPCVTNHTEVTEYDRVLVRVDTDAGVTGWGEMRVFLDPVATTTILERGIAPHVVGRSPFEVETFRRSVYMEYTNVDVFFAAVEMACWDIVGKALEKPVYELLGGWTAPVSEHRRRTPDYQGADAVDVAYVLGILPPEEAREHAARAADAGYATLKAKAGRDWQADLAQLAAMEEAVGDEVALRVDPNQGWRPDEAVRVATGLADAGVRLEYIEQPIRVNDHATLARLRGRTTQPIAANEDTYLPNNARRLVEQDAIDVAVVDMTPAGGIAGLRQLAAVFEDANVPLVHHCAGDLGVRTAAILHAVTGIPGFALPMDTVYDAMVDDVIADPFELTDGTLSVPDGPGFGVTVDETKVERYRHPAGG